MFQQTCHVVNRANTHLMKSKALSVSINIGIVVTSLVFVVLVLELIVFRVIFVASDLPVLAENDGGVLRYEPNKSGRYRIKNDINAVFSINEQGWNSGVSKYTKTKLSVLPRVCIIGDSFVEALQVDYTKSFAEQLMIELDGRVDSVYRFGLSGAPLSHYLYLLKQEVVKYNPQIVVINLVHNDFLESIEPGDGTYSNSLARVGLSENELELVSPMPYTRNSSWWIKKSAIYRYVWVRNQIRPKLAKHYWMKFTEPTYVPKQYIANVPADSIEDQRIPKVIEFIFQQIRELAETHKFEVLLLMDTDRKFIETSGEVTNTGSSPAARLNSWVAQSAKRNDLDFIDLTAHFAKDYQINQVPFSFRTDGHWNFYAHKLVAKVVGSFIGTHIE